MKTNLFRKSSANLPHHLPAFLAYFTLCEYIGIVRAVCVCVCVGGGGGGVVIVLWPGVRPWCIYWLYLIDLLSGA